MNFSINAANKAAVALLIVAMLIAPVLGCPDQVEFKKSLRKALFEFMQNPKKATLNFTELNSSVALYTDNPWSGAGASTYCHIPQPVYSNVNFTRVLTKINSSIPRGIVPTCSDGTYFGDCSEKTKPLFCAAGRLVDRCGVCLCSPQTCETTGMQIGCCGTCKGEYKRCGNNASISIPNASYAFARCTCGTEIRSTGSCCDGVWSPSTTCSADQCFSGSQCFSLGFQNYQNYTCHLNQPRQLSVQYDCNLTADPNFCQANIMLNQDIGAAPCTGSTTCVPGVPVCVTTAAMRLTLTHNNTHYFVSTAYPMQSITVEVYHDRNRYPGPTRPCFDMPCAFNESFYPQSHTEVDTFSFIAYGNDTAGQVHVSDWVRYT